MNGVRLVGGSTGDLSRLGAERDLFSQLCSLRVAGPGPLKPSNTRQLMTCCPPFFPFHAPTPSSSPPQRHVLQTILEILLSRPGR